jgi:hypothetical protein
MDEQRKLNSQLESRVANLSAESNSLIEEKSALEQQVTPFMMNG